MPRISAKQQLLEEQIKVATETKLRKNTLDCTNFLMQRLGLEVNQFGYICMEDEDEITEFVFDGKRCKDINSMINFNTSSELAFDPYNNVKLCCGLLQYYISTNTRKETQMMYLSNKATNDTGTLTLTFTDGATIEGNTYNKDTLKYIDMIIILDGATPLDYKMLKGMDVDGYSPKR